MLITISNLQYNLFMKTPKKAGYIPFFLKIMPGFIIHHFNTFLHFVNAGRAKQKSTPNEPGWLANTMDEALFSMDTTTGVLSQMSASSEKLFGYTAEEFMADVSLWKTILYPADKYLVIKNDHTLRTKKIASAEYRIIHKDTSIRWIRCRTIPVIDNAGNLVRIDGFCRDVTERKHLEASLKRSEANLRAVFDNTDVAYLLVDTNMQLISFNEEARKIALNQFNKILNCGDKILEYLVPEKRNGAAKIIKEVLEVGNRSFEKSRVGFDGRKKCYDIQLFSVPDDQHKIFALAITIRDISKYKQAQEKIRTSESKYRYLFDSNPAAILIWDIEDFGIREVNTRALSLYGYTKEEFLQKTLVDIRPPDDFEKFVSALQVLHSKDGEVNGRWRHLNKKGEIMYMDIMARKVIYQGKPLVLTIANNVTEKIKLENRLADQQIRKQYEITNAVITAQEQDRAHLAGELHDNINQILATASLYLDCALKNNPDHTGRVREAKKFILDAVAEIRKLSKSLVPPSLENKALKEALHDLMANVADVQPIQFNKDWQTLDETLMSDKLKLTIYRIVQEQLNNIFKHAAAKNVTISLHQYGDIIQLIIKDDGKGFNVMEKRNGVGLQNIKSRADLLHGSVTINSSPGKGCELKIVFAYKENLEEIGALLN